MADNPANTAQRMEGLHVKTEPSAAMVVVQSFTPSTLKEMHAHAGKELPSSHDESTLTVEPPDDYADRYCPPSPALPLQHADDSYTPNTLEDMIMLAKNPLQVNFELNQVETRWGHTADLVIAKRLPLLRYSKGDSRRRPFSPRDSRGRVPHGLRFIR